MKNTFSVRQITDETRSFVDAQIAESWSGPMIVTRGILHDTRTHPGFVALSDGKVAGYILYDIAGGECEITVLESLREGQGVGRALTNVVMGAAKGAGCRRVWLVTTNDNTRALRFYQRLGFEWRAVYLNAMEASRKLKPQIPPTGNDEIPIKHEIEFALTLEAGHEA